jgi:hypothetical protein
MFNRIMNSSKTVSKDEVEKFAEIYEDGEHVKRIEDLENQQPNKEPVVSKLDELD